MNRLVRLNVLRMSVTNGYTKGKRCFQISVARKLKTPLKSFWVFYEMKTIEYSA